MADFLLDDTRDVSMIEMGRLVVRVAEPLVTLGKRRISVAPEFEGRSLVISEVRRLEIEMESVAQLLQRPEEVALLLKPGGATTCFKVVQLGWYLQVLLESSAWADLLVQPFPGAYNCPALEMMWCSMAKDVVLWLFDDNVCGLLPEQLDVTQFSV